MSDEGHRERGVFCIYCGFDWPYKEGDDIRPIYEEMKEHDRQCPKNPIVARLHEVERAASALLDWTDWLDGDPRCDSDYTEQPSKPFREALRDALIDTSDIPETDFSNFSNFSKDVIVTRPGESLIETVEKARKCERCEGYKQLLRMLLDSKSAVDESVRVLREIGLNEEDYISDEEEK